MKMDGSTLQRGPRSKRFRYRAALFCSMVIGIFSASISAVPFDQLFFKGINDDPVAIKNKNSIPADTTSPTNGNMIFDNDGWGIDFDPDGDPLTVIQIQINGETSLQNVVNGIYGTLEWNPNGAYSYTVDNAHPAVQTLAVGETLTDTFTYTISDGHGGSNSANLLIIINGTNERGD